MRHFVLNKSQNLVGTQYVFDTLNPIQKTKLASKALMIPMAILRTEKNSSAFWDRRRSSNSTGVTIAVCINKLKTEGKTKPSTAARYLVVFIYEYNRQKVVEFPDTDKLTGVRTYVWMGCFLEPRAFPRSSMLITERAPIFNKLLLLKCDAFSFGVCSPIAVP